MNKKPNERVLVGLSGGVDSSVAASLLIDQGYSVEGAYIRCWSEGPYCSADRDQADAAKVASVLGIPFHVFDFEKEYREKVIDYFYSEYEAGKTPNPDVMCNKEIKFGLFLNKALDLGFDFVATGHYARISEQGSGISDQKNNNYKYRLLKGVDSNKDQSYFLYLLKENQLAKVLFPLGSLAKKEVRKIAFELKLPTADKPDSVGICFVGPTDIREFLRERIKPKEGDIISVDGKRLGKHSGLAFHTIGQRQGLGVSAPIPYYVVGKDLEKNRLVVAPFGHEALFSKKFTVEKVSWVGDEPRFPLEAMVKLRYRADDRQVELIKDKNGEIEAVLQTSERAITSGQSAVFYKGKQVLGGAVIDRVIN